jgi:hypothetical protein
MRVRLTRWRSRDWGFVGLAGLNLAVIVLYLATGLVELGSTGTGWRRVDVDAVRQRIDSGELSGREAQWYHPTRPGERSSQATRR